MSIYSNTGDVSTLGNNAGARANFASIQSQNAKIVDLDVTGTFNFSGAFTPTSIVTQNLVVTNSLLLPDGSITHDMLETGAVTLADAGVSGQASIVADGSGPDMTVRRLKQGAGIVLTQNANDIEIANVGAGTTPTTQTLGGAVSLIPGGTQTSFMLDFKGLTGGPQISLVENANDIVISYEGGSPSDVTLVSAGGTQSLVNDGAGPDLATKGLTAGTKGIGLTSDATSVTIENTQTIQGSGTGNSWVNIGSGAATHVLKDVIVGSGLTLLASATDITIANTATISGTGTGSSVIKTGTANYVTKDLKAGDGILLTAGVDDITITNSDPASTISLNSAGGIETLVSDGSPPALFMKGLSAGTAISLTGASAAVTIANTATIAGTGTGSSIVKTGTPNYVTKDLVAGTGISLTAGANDITITNTDSGANVTLTNVGPVSSPSLVNDGVGPALAIKGLTAGTGIVLASTATDITVDNNTTIAGTGTGNSWVKTGGAPVYALKDAIAGSGITVTSGTNDLTIAANVGAASASTLLTADTTGALTRAGTTMPIELYYIMLSQDTDGGASRIDNVITYTTSAGGGAQKNTATTAGTISATNYPAGSSTHWKNPSTGDFITVLKNGNVIAQTQWVFTVTTAAAAGIYWAEFRWIGNYGNAIAEDVVWSLFINDTIKTGIYCRSKVDSVTTRTLTMNGFVTLQNGDSVRPKVVASNTGGVLTSQMQFSIRQWSTRTA